MRKFRENGWLDANGVTHHINTHRVEAYRRDLRRATCGVNLSSARRVRFDVVDCMTCIVYVARRPRRPPRPTPAKTAPSWWTKDGDRHVLSVDDPWRAVCGASIRGALASGNPPNCIPCGAKPSAVAKRRSWQTPDGVRHRMRPDEFEGHALCGADLFAANDVRKAPNCAECRAARGQKGNDRVRPSRTERR